MYSNSQGRERKRIRDDFGSFGPANSGARHDFLFRERIDNLSQKRSRGSWGERGEWDNEHGQILDRQLSDRQNLDRERESREIGSRDIGSRDLGPRDIGARDVGARDIGARDIGSRDIGVRDIGSRDVGWDRGLNSRGRVSGRDDSYFGASSSGVGRERFGDDNEHRWSSGGRDGPSAFPSESGIYRSHSASEYENDRGNSNDLWHSGYRDGFDRDRIRRERDERDKPGPGSTGHNRRPSPLYFEQSRGSSREREKVREHPREVVDITRGRYQRSLSPHYSEPNSLRRTGLPSVDGYPLTHSKSYWSRPSGPDIVSSSSNKVRSHSPNSYHIEDRELMRSEGAGRGSRADAGRHSFGSNDEFRGSFDGHRRTGPVRDDNGGPNSGFMNGFGGFSHPSRDRYPSFPDQDTDRGEVRGNRGFWGASQGLNRGGFFAGRGGINRFGCNLDGIGRSTHSALSGVRPSQIQRRTDEVKKQPAEDRIPASSSTDENVQEGVTHIRSSTGNNKIDTAPEDVVEQGEGSDNMEIDTDTQEVMATPVRRLRTITDPDVMQFLLLREALMDYALAKSLCSIGVKPASFRSIMQQDVSLSSKGLNTNVQPSKNSLDFAESTRQTGRSNTPVSSSSTSSSSRPLGSDQGMKGSRGTESSSGKEQQSTRTGSVDANGVSRQQGQSRLPDKNGVTVSSGASRAAPLPPYPKTGSRSQPQPPPSNPPYNQQQYGHGQGQGQDCNYLSPNQQQQRSYQNNPSASYNDCYNYNRSNPSQRNNSDNPNLHGQSHHLEEGRPRPPQGPPKGPGRGPQPPLPPVPAPPTR